MDPACDPTRGTSFEQNLTYGVPNDTQNDFMEVDFKDTLSSVTYEGYMHAAHAMIYCMHEQTLWNRFKQPANILMQPRCDGNLGFPGGLLDKIYEEAVVDGLNRELEEEMHLDLSKHKFQQSEHLSSHVVNKKRLILHFYVKEVTPQEFAALEKRVIDSEEWGVETFGILRVPLFAMDDGFRGFPVFLANQFSGNAKHQLIRAIRTRKILSDYQLDTFLEAHTTYMSKTGNKL